MTTESTRPSRREKAAHAFLLLAATLLFSAALRAAGIPASLLMGSMIAAIAVSSLGHGATLSVPKCIFLLSQAVIGCMVAASMTRGIVADIIRGWPFFLLIVASVSAVCALLGWLLAKRRVFPGTTAIWGTSPGAALIMTVMSENHNADPRLVAFMQYLRVVMVTVTASAAAGIWGTASSVPTVEAGALSFGAAETLWPLALCLTGMAAAYVSRSSSAAMLFPLILGAVLNVFAIVPVAPHPWLVVFANIFVGWGIGLRFNRAVLRHAFRTLPITFVSFAILIAASGGLGLLFGSFMDVDPLTAFLAATPGGMDAMAVITASIGGNTSFVMAVQATRFILVTLTGPALASLLAGRVQEGTRRMDGEN